MNTIFEDQAISLWLLIYSYKNDGKIITYVANSTTKIINYVVGTIATLNADNINDEITHDLIDKLRTAVPKGKNIIVNSPEVIINVVKIQLTPENIIHQLMLKLFDVANDQVILDQSSRKKITDDILGLFDCRDN